MSVYTPDQAARHYVSAASLKRLQLLGDHDGAALLLDLIPAEDLRGVHLACGFLTHLLDETDGDPLVWLAQEITRQTALAGVTR